MYELIIFTMMQPNVEPRWQHMAPTSQSVCLQRKRKFNKIFVKVDGLVYSFTCELVKKPEGE